MQRTVNYDLCQYEGSDKTSYLINYNGDMLKIDTAIKGAKDAADNAQSKANGADGKADANAASISTLDTQINGASGLAADVTAVQGSVNTINSLIGTGEPTTQDKTIIGAINELAAEMPSPTTQLPATAISYDNTNSGLTADDVQEAIDEVKSLVPTLIDITDQITTSGGTTIERAKVYGKLVEIDITIAANLTVSSTVFTIASAYAPPTPASFPSTRLNSEGIVEVADTGTATYYNDAVFASSQTCHIVYTID